MFFCVVLYGLRPRLYYIDYQYAEYYYLRVRVRACVRPCVAKKHLIPDRIGLRRRDRREYVVGFRGATRTQRRDTLRSADVRHLLFALFFLFCLIIYYILYTVRSYRPKLRVAPLFYHVLPAVATPYTCDAVDLFCPVLGVFWRRTHGRTHGRTQTHSQIIVLIIIINAFHIRTTHETRDIRTM